MHLRSYIKDIEMNSDIYCHPTPIKPSDRAKRLGHNACIVWLTGLSGAGKSSIAYALESQLFHLGAQAFTLDGDNIRHGLNSDLSFTQQDRTENIRRISEVSRLFLDSGHIVLCAFISPFRADRHAAKQLIGEQAFIEVFVDTPIDICEQRDVKGLYEKAKNGDIKNFTGISSTYEPPQNPDLHITTPENTVDMAVQKIISLLSKKAILSRPTSLY